MERAASPSGNGGLPKAVVAFVCERLSLAVVAIGTVFMVVVFAVVEYNSLQLGLYPLVLENDTSTVQVVAGASPAPPLQTGDRLDLAALTPQQRFSLLRGAHAHEQIVVQAARAGRTFTATLVSGSPDFTRRATLTRDVGVPLSFFLSLGLATALFLMRPRPITLAFYFYTILMLLKINQAALDLARWPANIASDLAIQVVYPLTQLMILIFAHRLYGRASRAWPWLFGTAIALSVIVFLVWVDPIVWTVFQVYGMPGPTNLFMSLSDTLLLVVVLATLAYIASGATALDRRRVTWVIAGIALGPILDLTWAFANVVGTLAGSTSIALNHLQVWAAALLPWFNLTGSIFVLYGFLSERVIDFRFAIGRAAVYGAVTAALLLLFGTIEWGAEQIFESTQPAIYISLFAALVIGFSLNALHGRIEGFLNSVFFRDQHVAEEALRRAARALANTSSEKTLIEFLVDEPIRVLGLTSAALFLAPTSGSAFERRAERGWSRRDAEAIEAEDPLIVELRADLAPVMLDGRPRAATILPGGPKAPSLVVPLVMRGSVFGFVLYGTRGNGIALSADEQALLEAIARSASAAYDHIDADRSHARIRELEAQLQRVSS
ncbi:MAG TPA: GAF domain-containing protein [Candidatus Cybelea sp.]|nr:GAF domain-containing protein [Candidatus Cybelea sp.]